MRFEGVVRSGMKEAGGYVAAYNDAFQEHFGVRFYPGTLNLETKEPIRLEGGITIPPPREGLHEVRCIPITINGAVKGCIVIPGIQRHPDTIVEILAPVHLRDHFEITDGDVVTCESA